MNMHKKMKDECLVATVLFLASMLVADSSGSLLLKIESPPTVRKVNEMFSAFCRDSGGQPVTWRGPKGVLGPKTRPMVHIASYGTIMSINKTRIEDTGTYKCSAGGDSKTFNLTVLGTLFIGQPNATKVVDENFVVSCSDSAGRAVSWKGPKGPLGPKTRPGVKYFSSATSIVFNRLRTEDSGMYTCSAGNEHKKYYLTVQDQVQFMDTNDIQDGIEGRQVNLRCEVKGGSVAWSVEGGDISDKSKYEVLADGLLIKKLHRNDSKSYICKGVQASTGYVRDRKIKLRVKHKPEPVYANQEIACGYIGGIVNLTCTVVAYPPAKFEWLKKSDRKHKIGKLILESNNTSILQMYVDKTTFGEYICLASNEFGQLERRFTLEEGAQLNPPKDIVLRGSNASILDLSIVGPDRLDDEENSSLQIKGFSVEFKMKEGEDWERREFNLSAADSYVLDELEGDKEYEVRVATRNRCGLSDFSNSSVFKSRADGVCLDSSYVYLLVVNVGFALGLTDWFRAFW